MAVRLFALIATVLAAFALWGRHQYSGIPEMRVVPEPTRLAQTEPDPEDALSLRPAAPQAPALDLEAETVHAASLEFRAAIIGQIEHSVAAVLQENARMREMALEFDGAAALAKGQFQQAMSGANEAEGGIAQLNIFGDELAQSIALIRAQVERSVAVVKDATDQAAVTRGQVEGMAKLSGAMSEVIGMIDDVARETRILAVNAAIQAAQAGEAGLGFAVVANEVKTLADRTTSATHVIRHKIGQLSGMMVESVDSLQTLVTTIAHVDAASGSIGLAITEQTSAAGRVAANLAIMREAVTTLSREIREAAQRSANSRMLSEEVLETVNVVDDLVRGLKDRSLVPEIP